MIILRTPACGTRGAWRTVSLFVLLFLAAGCRPVDLVGSVAPIIADHTVVERYAAIPQAWIDKVKTMWLDVPGESHSQAYRTGLQLLAGLDSRFAVSVTEGGAPEAFTDTHLRASRATWGDVNNASGWRWEYGEEDWYTSATAISRTKAHLAYCAANSLAVSAMGFGWCWDMTWINGPGGTEDPVYQVHWAGSSDGGPRAIFAGGWTRPTRR